MRKTNGKFERATGSTGGNWVWILYSVNGKLFKCCLPSGDKVTRDLNSFALTHCLLLHYTLFCNAVVSGVRRCEGIEVISAIDFLLTTLESGNC